MSLSILQLQREIVLRRFKETGRADEWKVLICDKDSRELLANVASEDDVVGTGVTQITRIEDGREAFHDTSGMYFLSPLPHIVEWLRADLRRGMYPTVYVIWTSQLHPGLAARIPQTEPGRQAINHTCTLNIDFFPRESHLATFRDSDSFQILFNRHCDPLVKQHLDDLTKKIVSVCVSLGEHPLVRYYRPKSARHEAAVLCTHLAKFVQDGLDDYARVAPDFPPPSPRSRAVLLITDRSMDVMAPLVHELTYEAMAMDLLPILDGGDQVKYETDIPDETNANKNLIVALNEIDKIWVENRHLHMKDLLVKLSDDFKKFQAKNPQFANKSDQNISVNTIKDMLAGLPEFQEGKKSFSVHIEMAEKCAKRFQDQKLLDVTSVEQSLATGLDEDNNTPRNVADQLVRLLDDDSVILENRTRLLMMYILYRGGILYGDIEKLRKHGGLSEDDRKKIDNLENLGVRVWRKLSDPVVPFDPLYTSRRVQYAPGEEVSLSRFEPMLKYALDEICQGSLDVNKFPPTRPHLDNQGLQSNAQTSLRSAGKPTWASTRPSANKPRQRIIVFIAGGATYSEARACYEVSQQMGKDVFLATTNMLTPQGFLQQMSKLDLPRRALDLTIDKAAPAIPGWMARCTQEAQRPQQAPKQQQRPTQPSSNRPPTEAMQSMSLNPQKQANGPPRPAYSQTPPPPSTGGSYSTSDGSGKLKKEKDKDKKKHNPLGMFRKH